MGWAWGLGLLFRSGGWLEIWRIKPISTQIVVEDEVGVELGNIKIIAAMVIMYVMAILALMTTMAITPDGCDNCKLSTKVVMT